MFTFLQFITEAESFMPYGEWGIIHPKTGRLISGDKHPEATIHKDLKDKIKHKFPNQNMKDFPEYAHVKAQAHDEPYLMIRGIHKGNAKAVMHAYGRLPHTFNDSVHLTGNHFYHEGQKDRGYGMLRTYANDPSARFDRK